MTREGVLQRKHLLVREYKRASNRSWAATYAQLCGSTLFMHKASKASKRDKDKLSKGDRLLGHIIVRHAYCAQADNPRRPFCFTLVAYDQSSWMFQASSAQDCDVWNGKAVVEYRDSTLIAHCARRDGYWASILPQHDSRRRPCPPAFLRTRTCSGDPCSLLRSRTAHLCVMTHH